MLRDRRDPPSELELLAAYVDGVAELTPEDRRRVEDHLASDPAARADESATRALLGQLRDLPPTGGAPDWGALERSISEAVGPAAPRSWWQRFGWRLAMPCAALATVAAIMVAIRHPAPEPPAPEPPPVAVRAALPDDPTLQLWLDGASVEVDLAADELLDTPWDGDVNDEDLLPATDLAWVDELDGEALERAERWLAQQKRS